MKRVLRWIHTEGATPLAREVSLLQKKHPDAVLVVQVGSFYEIYDHAGYLDGVASLLGLRIARGRTRFAGFPLASARTHVLSLLRAGRSVALVHQVAKDNITAKMYSREVTRVVTPGTVLDDTDFSPSAPSFLTSVFPDCFLDDSTTGATTNITTNITATTTTITLASIDISTGQFFITPSSISSLDLDIARINPKEIIFPQNLSTSLPEFQNILPRLSQSFHLSPVPIDSFFNDSSINHFKSVIFKNTPKKALQYYSRSTTSDKNILKDYSTPQIHASAGLLAYVAKCFPGSDLLFQSPIPFNDTSFMKLDNPTLQALEIISPLRDKSSKSSLLNIIDKTATAAGSRLLAWRLKSPSLNLVEIARRHNLVETFLPLAAHDSLLGCNLKQLLAKSADINKNLQRLHLGTTIQVTIFSNLLDSMKISDDIKNILASLLSDHKKSLSASHKNAISALQDALGDYSHFQEKYLTFLAEGAGGQVTLGTISDGVDPDLDELRLELSSIKNDIVVLQNRLESQYGASFVGIHDSKYGAGIEFSKSDTRISSIALEHLKRDPNVLIFPKQRSTGKRFSHREWTRLFAKSQDCEIRILKQETLVFQDACEELKLLTLDLLKTSEAISEIDISMSNAILATEHQYTRPVMSKDDVHIVDDCRHPVVEYFQGNRGRSFVSNPISLTKKERIWVITGPNMGGKSTFLRQCALISILAQAGCYVPAKKALLGVVDGIYSRIGASDDLSANESTFMVEMKETAHILANATPKSLVIMDEVGRGTSTMDGFSLAYAIVKHLVNTNKCRGLFTTHYHELATRIVNDRIKGVGCYKTTVNTDHLGTLVCMYKIEPGIMNSSHGIAIAEAAGIPSPVIEVAKQVYKSMEGEAQ